MRRNGHPAAAYAWHVAPGGVLVVVDLDRDGWCFAAHDAAGVVRDLAELRPDLLAPVPLIAYRDSMGQWDALRVTDGWQTLGERLADPMPVDLAT